MDRVRPKSQGTTLLVNIWNRVLRSLEPFSEERIQKELLTCGWPSVQQWFQILTARNISVIKMCAWFVPDHDWSLWVWPADGSQVFKVPLLLLVSLCGGSIWTQPKTALVIMIEPGSLGKHLYTLAVPKNVRLCTHQHTWKDMAAHSFTLARTHTMHK